MAAVATPKAVKQTVDVCVSRLIDPGTQNLKWTYSKCESGSFSCVYKIHFSTPDEEDGAIQIKSKPWKNSVICKSRLISSDSCSSSVEKSQNLIQQRLSLKVQMHLYERGLAPEILFVDPESGLEIQENLGGPTKARDLDVVKVARLLAQVHFAIEDFSESTDAYQLPTTWTDANIQPRMMLSKLREMQDDICGEFEAEKEFSWVTKELEKLGMGKSLCHNDFYANNILDKQSNEEAPSDDYAIIDFDMIGLHWFGYDIASFFYTHCRTDTPQGTVELKLESIPGREIRKMFISTYIQECHKIGRMELQLDGNHLMDAVDLLMCYGWLFSSTTRYTAYLLNGRPNSFVGEIQKRLKFYRQMKADWQHKAI